MNKMKDMFETTISLILFILIIIIVFLFINFGEIIRWFVGGIILSIFIDYVMFSIWYYYAHKEELKK